MKKEKTISVLFLVQSAMIAAIYVVLTIVFAPISFGQIQFRIAEALTILPAFTPAAIPGLFVGCLIGNILGGAILPDIIVGSMATLLGAIFTYLFFIMDIRFCFQFHSRCLPWELVKFSHVEYWV